jgi:hypothetical protein
MARKKASGSPQTHERKRQEKAERAARRRRTRLIQAGGVVAVAAAVIVVLTAMTNRREALVQDLSQIGNGVPAVVQVWDITCPICNENRANVERIDQDYSDDELLIRVADMRNDDAVRFAARYTDRRRQTMLFFDGSGELTDIVTGGIEVDTLRSLFDAQMEMR